MCGVQRAVCSVQRAACSNCCERGVGRQGLRESGQCCTQLQDGDDPHQNDYLKLRKQCSGCAGEHPPSIYDTLAYKTAPTFMCCVHLCPTMYTTTHICAAPAYIYSKSDFLWQTDSSFYIHIIIIIIPVIMMITLLIIITKACFRWKGVASSLEKICTACGRQSCKNVPLYQWKMFLASKTVPLCQS